MKKQQHRYVRSITQGKQKVILCEDCGYWHLHPMPSRDKLKVFYREKYYGCQKKNNNRTMTDKQRDPDGFYRIQYADRLRRIMKYLPVLMDRTVLDIGAGYGDFLRFLVEKGWVTKGIEPSAETENETKYSNSIGMIQADVDEMESLALPRSSVVTLNNVLEHIRDPQKLLRHINSNLLARGGLLYVIVPNDFNVLQSIIEKAGCCDRQKERYWVCLPDHLNYWDIDSMKSFVEKCGFKVLQETADFPMEMFILMGDNYVNNPSKGREAHLRRVMFEKNIERAGAADIKDRLYESLASCGVGRDMHIIAVKK